MKTVRGHLLSIHQLTSTDPPPELESEEGGKQKRGSDGLEGWRKRGWNSTKGDIWHATLGTRRSWLPLHCIWVFLFKQQKSYWMCLGTQSYGALWQQISQSITVSSRIMAQMLLCFVDHSQMIGGGAWSEGPVLSSFPVLVQPCQRGVHCILWWVSNHRDFLKVQEFLFFTSGLHCSCTSARKLNRVG